MRAARGMCCGAAALALAACGGAAVTGIESGDALAALAVIDQRAVHRPVTATAFTEVDEVQPLAAGDVVRTDASGFAEIEYGDGSLTRLDRDTTVTVVALDGDVTVPEIELDLDIGRVWNRVRTVTGERGRFEVHTDVGTAAVRGTAFSVRCTAEPVCTFTVTEGLVVVSTLDGREIEIAAGEVVSIGRQDDDVATRAAPGADGDAAADGGGDGPGGGAAGPGPAARSIELERTSFSLDPSEQQPGQLPAADWLRRNTPLDSATGGRFGGEREQCSVTVAGRNIEHATTPETAIEADIDETLHVDAVATGQLERYVVDVHLGGLSFRAAEGEVLADANGDRTTFRGDIDVAEYAEWGVGLYEVTAATTGTSCQARAFVKIVGRSPLTTGGGIFALLAMLLGSVGLYGAHHMVSDVSLFGFGGGDG